MNFSLNSFSSSVTFVFAFVTDYTIQKIRADVRLPEEIEARRREELTRRPPGSRPVSFVRSGDWLA